MSISGQYNISLKINEEKYDLLLSSVRHLAIFENASDLLPTLEMQLVDPIYDRNLIPIYDGSIIEISLTPTVDQSQENKSSGMEEGSDTWMSFRVFKCEIVTESNVDILNILAYYNSPEYFSIAAFDYYEGSSSSVAEKIATKCNLKFDGDTSNDTQIWYQAGQTSGAFLHEVARHAWKDNNSCFVNCVTKDGVLKFFNLGDRIKSSPVWDFINTNVMFIPLKDKEVAVTSMLSSPNSGTLNRWRGYGVVSGNENFISGEYNSVHVDNIQKSTEKLAINKDLAKPTRYEVGPIDIGNTHKNYFKSYNQNIRLLSTFSDTIKVITNRPKKIALLDRVMFKEQKDTPGSLRMNYSGEYFVTHIGTFLINGAITINYGLTKEGVNTVSSDSGDRTDLL